MGFALFRGDQGGDVEQGFTRESFKQGLISGCFHDKNKVIREFLNDSHELRYPGPGDAEVVVRGGLCSLILRVCSS